MLPEASGVDLLGHRDKHMHLHRSQDPSFKATSDVFSSWPHSCILSGSRLTFLNSTPQCTCVIAVMKMTRWSAAECFLKYAQGWNLLRPMIHMQITRHFSGNYDLVETDWDLLYYSVLQIKIPSNFVVVFMWVWWIYYGTVWNMHSLRSNGLYKSYFSDSIFKSVVSYSQVDILQMCVDVLCQVLTPVLYLTKCLQWIYWYHRTNSKMSFPTLLLFLAVLMRWLNMTFQPQSILSQRKLDKSNSTMWVTPRAPP